MALILLFFGAVFLYFSTLMFDSDLGWALRWGQHMLEHGITKIDPFSYTMPTYLFVDHEWLIHIAQYLLFETGGPLLLGVAFVIPLLLTIWLLTKQTSTPWKTIHSLLLGAYLLQAFIPKPSLFTLFFLSLMLFALRRHWRLRYQLAPLLFLLWANIHGGFLFALCLFTAWELGNMIEQKKIHIAALVSLAASVLATLVNPYGLGLWRGVFESVADARLRSSISEWQPSFSVVHLGAMFIISIYLTVLWYRRKTLRPTEILLLTATFVLGMSSRRNLPLWIVFTAPYVNEGVSQLEHTVRRIPGAASRLRKAYIGLFIFVSFVLLYEVFFITSQMRLRSESFYPRQAITHLQQHPCSGHVFTPYEWGGYYLWKNPGKHVFIDGRMPSWKNPQATFPESTDALSDMYSILSGSYHLPDYTARYQITCFLLPRALVNPTAKNISSKDAQRTASFRKQLHTYTTVIYQDDVSVVLKLNEAR